MHPSNVNGSLHQCNTGPKMISANWQTSSASFIWIQETTEVNFASQRSDNRVDTFLCRLCLSNPRVQLEYFVIWLNLLFDRIRFNSKIKSDGRNKSDHLNFWWLYSVCNSIIEANSIAVVRLRTQDCTWRYCTGYATGALFLEAKSSNFVSWVPRSFCCLLKAHPWKLIQFDLFGCLSWKFKLLKVFGSKIYELLLALRKC